jgi:hypothetical protein
VVVVCIARIDARGKRVGHKSQTRCIHDPSDKSKLYRQIRRTHTLGACQYHGQTRVWIRDVSHVTVPWVREEVHASAKVEVTGGVSRLPKANYRSSCFENIDESVLEK